MCKKVGLVLIVKMVFAYGYRLKNEIRYNWIDLLLTTYTKRPEKCDT